MAKSSRVPPAVGAIPVVGDLMRQADNQAQWLQDLVEQNARLVSQLPATIKTFNDSLEQFNKTVQRLDRAANRLEAAANQITGPLNGAAVHLERVRDLPEAFEAMRREALPALRAATDTQRQVAMLTSTVERVINLVAELPGMGILRRVVPPRPDAALPRPDAAPPRPDDGVPPARPHRRETSG